MSDYTAKHDGCKRQFVQLSKTWYAEIIKERKDLVDEFELGFYFPDGSTSGEFRVCWTELFGKIVPCLYAYDDGWSALYQFSDVLKKMAEVDGRRITPNKFREILLSSGVEDATQSVKK